MGTKTQLRWALLHESAHPGCCCGRAGFKGRNMRRHFVQLFFYVAFSKNVVFDRREKEFGLLLAMVLSSWSRQQELDGVQLPVSKGIYTLRGCLPGRDITFSVLRHRLRPNIAAVRTFFRRKPLRTAMSIILPSCSSPLLPVFSSLLLFLQFQGDESTLIVSINRDPSCCCRVLGTTTAIV